MYSFIISESEYMNLKQMLAAITAATIRIPTYLLTMNESTSRHIGNSTAFTESGSICATIVCVFPELSSIIFLVFPDEFMSKNENDPSRRAFSPFFFMFVSSLKANRWLHMSAAIYVNMYIIVVANIRYDSLLILE